MNYQNYKINEEELLKAFASMIRYANNNLEGQFILSRAAAKLGITEEAIEIMLEIFQDCGMIKILTREENAYNISVLKSTELSKVFETPRYAEFSEIMSNINDYKNSFMIKDLV